MGMGESVCIHTILYAVQLVLVVRGYMQLYIVPSGALVEMDITLLTSC